MSDPKDRGDDPAKTVFMPSGQLSGASPSPAAGDSESGETPEDAWFAGGEAQAEPEAPAAPEPPPRSSWDDAPAAPAEPPSGGWGSPPAESYAPPPAPPPPPPAAAGEGRITVGMTLNHIFEVRRFIARGGMGEVYEGVNINTDERVAIKVILSHLARDPNVQAMFRKEARTLTRLSHPALVQYRVLAQEPSLSVLYIVTEYIDGVSLGDSIGKIRPSAEELIALTRRLASGLQAAHELGAIHRDIAPDNVLLPEGRLDQAKVIDFGIAKDLDPTNKTIVGDGFAGKLGFVAPEQFGDYNREVGPWTDVYSLALVILSVAAGRAIDMGATLVEAIEKRRAGPDLSVAPEQLRPVLAAMLRPNPTERLRSMREVIEALDAQTGAGASATAPAAPAPGRAPAKKASNLPLIVGSVIALVLVLGVGGFLLTRSKPAPDKGGEVAAVRESEKVRRAVEQALPAIACTWIDIDQVSDDASGVAIRVSGVAGSPVEAQQAIASAAKATGANVTLVDSSNVFPIGTQACAPLDAFRPLREPSSEMGRKFTSQQSNWELTAKNDPCVGPNAKAVVNLNIGAPQTNFSIVGMDRNGALQEIFADRTAFNTFHSQFPDFITDKGGDKFSATSCYNETGLVGQLLLTGQGPFDLGLPSAMVTDKGKPVDGAWLSNFKQLAQQRGWRTNMVWYRVVDDQPG